MHVTGRNDTVISLTIEGVDGGSARLRAVRQDHTGARSEHDVVVGREAEVRELARTIASAGDLVPVWADTSWISGDARRPPAGRWVRRDDPAPLRTRTSPG